MYTSAICTLRNIAVLRAVESYMRNWLNSNMKMYAKSDRTLTTQQCFKLKPLWLRLRLRGSVPLQLQAPHDGPAIQGARVHVRARRKSDRRSSIRTPEFEGGAARGGKDARGWFAVCVCLSLSLSLFGCAASLAHVEPDMRTDSSARTASSHRDALPLRATASLQLTNIEPCVGAPFRFLQPHTRATDRTTYTLSVRSGYVRACKFLSCVCVCWWLCLWRSVSHGNANVGRGVRGGCRDLRRARTVRVAARLPLLEGHAGRTARQAQAATRAGCDGCREPTADTCTHTHTHTEAACTLHATDEWITVDAESGPAPPSRWCWSVSRCVA